MKWFPSVSTYPSVRSERSWKSKMAYLCLSTAFPLMLLGGGLAGAMELTESGVQNSSEQSAATTPAALAAGDLYVAPNGSANNPGTLASPTTLANALTQIAPGKTIFCAAEPIISRKLLRLSEATAARLDSAKSGRLRYGKACLRFLRPSFLIHQSGFADVRGLLVG